MANQPPGTLLMEEASIIFRNFAGKEGMYNAEGDRNFCLLLDDATAQNMANDGWNIKTLRAREEGDPVQPYIQVSLKYRARDGRKLQPPTIVLITSKGRTGLNEEECEILDWVDIAKVDLIIRPNPWNVNGKSGIKAYLKSIYVTIQEDALQLKYADVPEIGSSQQPLAIEAGDGGDVIDVEYYEEDELAALPARSGAVDG